MEIIFIYLLFTSLIALGVCSEGYEKVGIIEVSMCLLFGWIVVPIFIGRVLYKINKKIF